MLLDQTACSYKNLDFIWLILIICLVMVSKCSIIIKLRLEIVLGDSFFSCKILHVSIVYVQAEALLSVEKGNLA